MNDPIIRVDNLRKTFGKDIVLDDLSMDLKRGEFVSLLGASGCGKTVLLHILSGLLKKTSGEIEYNFPGDKNIDISMAFQRSPLFPWLTLEENIKICMNNRGPSEKEKADTVTAHLQKAHLEPFRRHYPNEISGGMTQKVNILRCFCSGGELILMDEPFVFLDFIQRTELQKFALDIWREEKRTILFVTHNIHEALILSDRILLMSAPPGRIIKEFDVGLPRPRDVEEIRSGPEYISLFREINSLLSVEIRKTQESPRS